jgi:hypothetical protein
MIAKKKDVQAVRSDVQRTRLISVPGARVSHTTRGTIVRVKKQTGGGAGADAGTTVRWG